MQLGVAILLKKSMKYIKVCGCNVGKCEKLRRCMFVQLRAAKFMDEMVAITVHSFQLFYIS